MKPTWRPGKQPGTVVTDRIADGPELASHIDFYGGYLVAESIAPENVGPISATVDLLEAAKELLAIAYASGRGGIVEFRPHEFDDLADAVAKAEKKTGDSMTQPIPTGTYFTCQGACYPHRGAIHNVHVFDESKDWGFFTYCEAAISEDRSRGFTVEEVEQP